MKQGKGRQKCLSIAGGHESGQKQVEDIKWHEKKMKGKEREEKNVKRACLSQCAQHNFLVFPR